MTAALRLFAGGLLILFLALQPAAAQRAGWNVAGDGVVTLDAAASEQWIPFVETPTGLVMIRALVGGRPVLALVDTGSPYTAIDTGWARRAGIKLILTVAPSRKRIAVHVGSIDTMRIGPVSQAGGRLSAIDLSAASAMFGVELTMILGADILRHVAVEMDFDNQRLRLRQSGSKAPEGIAAPLAVTPKTYRFTTAMTVAGVPLGHALIDTGSTATINVTPRVWKRLPLAGARITTAHGNTLYGGAIWPLARFGGVAIGEAAIPGRLDVLSVSGGILDGKAEGLIGIDALRHFNLFLDPGAGRMTLSPRATPHRPAPPSTIGILGYGTDRGFFAQHVMKGSPAALAGIADGETICTIDGESIARGTPGARENWTARPVGTRLSLGLCSGRTVAVTLAEFY